MTIHDHIHDHIHDYTTHQVPEARHLAGARGTLPHLEPEQVPKTGKVSLEGMRGVQLHPQVSDPRPYTRPLRGPDVKTENVDSFLVFVTINFISVICSELLHESC